MKDLDRETARTETGTISDYFGATLGQLYGRFSQALARYTHNLLAADLLAPPLQTALLNQLGVNPWADDDEWPLVVYPRSLTVLAQVPPLLSFIRLATTLRSYSDIVQFYLVTFFMTDFTEGFTCRTLLGFPGF